MPATWRQCENCLDWRRDVTERSDYVGRPRVCPHCARAFETPTKTRADRHDRTTAPQAGGYDRLARFEKSLGTDLENRGRARERNADWRADAVPSSVLLE